MRQTPANVKAVLIKIAGCPDRGGSLPVSQQPEACGMCPGGGPNELYECRAGKGHDPGKVTTTDCVRCKSGGEV